MNTTSTYYKADIHFTATKRSRFYYVVAPIRGSETVSYARDVEQYKTVDKTRVPAIRNIWAKEHTLETPVPGADLFNSATGRSRGALTDTNAYDATGNKGFISMLHASQLNFAGMAPKNTAGTIECREHATSISTTIDTLEATCYPTLLSDGVTVGTNKTWDEQKTAGVRTNVVTVSGFENAAAYKLYYAVEDLETNTMSPLHWTILNTTRAGSVPPQIYPNANAKHPDVDGLSVHNVWTTRAVVNVTVSRPARVYWVAVRGDSLPFTKAIDIMYYGLLGRARYVTPITGTAVEVDKDETTKTGLGRTETNSPHRFIYDAGVVDYFRDGGVTGVVDGTKYGVSPYLPRTTRSHMEIGFLNKRFHATNTIRGLKRGATYTVYAVPVELDEELKYIGRIAAQNFTTLRGKECDFESSLGYMESGTYTPVRTALLPPIINEDIFAKGFAWTWRLRRSAAFPAPGDACFWSTYMQTSGTPNAYLLSQLRLRARFVNDVTKRASPNGLHYYFDQLWKSVQVFTTTVADGTDFFDQVRLVFPALTSATRPFDVDHDESMCFDFKNGDLLISNELVPTLTTQASFCVIVQAIPGTPTSVLRDSSSVVQATNKLSELDVRTGGASLAITLAHESWANWWNSTVSLYAKRGTFAASHLIASGTSASSLTTYIDNIVPYVTVTNTTLSFKLEKSFSFYTQADIEVKVVLDGRLTRSTIPIPSASYPSFTIVAPLRNVKIWMYDKAGIDAAGAGNRYNELSSLLMQEITDANMRVGQTSGANILMRWHLTTTPTGRDIFKPTAITALLNSVAISATPTTRNTHGFAAYKSNVLKAANCSVPDLAQYVVDCVLVPHADYTLVEDEHLTVSPITSTDVLRSGKVFTIIGGSQITIKKTKGALKVSPSVVTEEQIRSGVQITYDIVGDQFETDPLPGLTFQAFRAGSTTETDIGTEPSGFLGSNSFTSGVTGAQCQDNVCDFPSCKCSNQETCPAGCTSDATRGCYNPACDAVPNRGVGGMFRSKTLDGTDNKLANAPLSTRLVVTMYNPNYDCSQNETVQITVADSAIRSNGFGLTTTDAAITITPTQGFLTMKFTSPRGSSAGVLSESEIREGGLVIELVFSPGETFLNTAAGIECLFNGWQPSQVSSTQTAAFDQKRSELINANTAIKVLNSSRTATFTFLPGTTYNTQGNDVVKFDVFAQTACFRSGLTPRFLQGGSSSSVFPQFQVTDGNAMMSWASPTEYAVGTYTAVVTEADVRSGLSLGVQLVGDQWVSSSPPSWLASSVFKTGGITSITAVNAPVFASIIATSTSVDKTKSVRDANDASLFTIVLTPQPTYDISATETVLLSVPAASAGISSSGVTGNFEPTFGTASGLLLKVLAFKIEVQPSVYVTVVGKTFDVSVKVAMSGWTAGASPDPSRARDAVPLPSVPQSTLVTGVRNSQSKLVIDSVQRLTGNLNASGSGVLSFSTSFQTAASCPSPCATLGLSVPSLFETLWDQRTAANLNGGVFNTIVDDWKVEFPTPLTAVTIDKPTPLFVTLFNGGLAPLAAQYKLRADVFIGLQKPFTRTVVVNESSVNFGSISVSYSITDTTLARIEFSLLTSAGVAVIVSNREVKYSFDIKLIPAGAATYELFESALPDEPFTVHLRNLDAVGKEASLVDSLNQCDATNRKVYNNVTVLAGNTATFTVPAAGNVFPISTVVCIDGKAVGGVLTVSSKPSATYKVLTDVVRPLEESRIVVVPGTPVESGMSFFLTNSTCDLAFAAPMSGVPAPLVSTRTDGLFTFTLSDELEASKLYVCFKPAGASSYTIISSPAVTVQMPSSDVFDTPFKLRQYETFYIRLTSRSLLNAYKEVALVKKTAAASSCSAFGQSRIPTASLVRSSSDNPSRRNRWSVAEGRRWFRNFFMLPTTATYEFRPIEATVAAMFCTRSHSRATWRTVILQGSTSTDTVRIIPAPRYQLVAAQFAQIGTDLKLSITMDSTSSSAVYLTSYRTCNIVPQSSSQSDAHTSGIFSGITSGATSGLSIGSDGALTLMVPGARLPTMPHSSMYVCVDPEGTGKYELLRRETGGYEFELRAGAPHHVVVETNGMSPCPITAIQQRNYWVQPLNVRVEDANNLTVTTAEGTVRLDIECYSYGKVTPCSIVGRNTMYMSKNRGGVITMPSVYIRNVQFGGTFTLRASFGGVAADVLHRDMTCNGTLQFSRVGELTMGGSVLNGFNVPSNETGFLGANIILRLTQDTFKLDLCPPPDAPKLELLAGITRTSDGKSSLAANLFSIEKISFSTCTSTMLVFNVNKDYMPLTPTETWTVNVPKTRFTSGLDATMTGPKTFTLMQPIKVMFNSTSTTMSENALAYTTGFNVTLKIPTGFRFVDPGAFVEQAPAFRDAIMSAPKNHTLTASTFIENRLAMVPLDKIRRVDDQTVEMSVIPNMNYHIADVDSLQFFVPSGAIVGYTRAEYAGSVTVTPSKDASRLNVTLEPQTIVAGAPFKLTVSTFDSDDVVVPLSSMVVVKSSAALFGDVLTLNQGHISGNYTIQQAGSFQVVVSLADVALPASTFTVNVSIHEPSLSAKTLIMPPSIVGPGAPFDVAVSITDKFGNAIPDNTAVTLRATECAASQKASSMRRRLMQATVEPTQPPTSAPTTTPTPTTASTLFTATSTKSEVRFTRIAADAVCPVLNLTVLLQGRTMSSFATEVSSTVFTFLGATPAVGSVLLPSADAYVSVVFFNDSKPVNGTSVSFTTLMQAARINSTYARVATTDVNGVARMLLQFPTPGQYQFIATAGAMTTKSNIIVVAAGPAVSLTVTGTPTPTSATSVTPRTSFQITVTGYDLSGYMSESATNNLAYSFTGPANSSLLEQPATATLNGGVGVLTFSVSASGTYSFTICLAGAPDASIACSSTTVYATGAMADLTLDSGNTFTDCTLVSITARFNASTTLFPDMYVSWEFLDAYGNGYLLPGGWKVGDAINYESSNVLGAKLATLANSMALSVDLQSGVARAQFRPGQVGLTSSFRVAFALVLQKGAETSGFRQSVAVERDLTTNLPRNIQVTAPPAYKTNSSQPSITIVDASVFTTLSASFDYDGCSMATAYWMCEEYSSMTSTTPLPCMWIDEDGVSSAYIATNRKGTELRIAPRSLPAPPAYRSYTFVVNNVRAAPIDIQADVQNFRVTMDRESFYGQQSPDTQNPVLYNVYCVRPPGEVSTQGVLSYDPHATDSLCTGCQVSWYYDNLLAIGNLHSFITAKGFEATTDISRVEQPIYGVRIYSVQTGTHSLRCEVSKPGQEARKANKTISVTWLSQVVPDFSMRHIRPTGQLGPHNRNEEEGLRVLATLGNDTKNFFEVPTGYSALTYTATAKDANGNVLSDVKLTHNGAQVSSVVVNAGSIVGPAVLMANGIPAAAVTVNVTATLTSLVGSSITTFLDIEIAQPPTFVTSSSITLVFSNAASSTS
eukprot:PhM_4_TR16766/c0_g2_i2/m.75026